MTELNPAYLSSARLMMAGSLLHAGCYCSKQQARAASQQPPPLPRLRRGRWNCLEATGLVVEPGRGIKQYDIAIMIVLAVDTA